jgi:putative polyhydroxyalkanoate system protein
MTSLSVRREHSLEPGELKKRVERIATKLADRFGAECVWHGDQLIIRHTSVNGTIRLNEHDLLIEATLGFPLSLMRSRAEAEIDRILERELQ